MGMADEPVLAFPAVDDWAGWLAAEHDTASGVWIRFAKKGTGIPSVRYAEVLDLALCYGWIDGQVRRLDEQFYVQRFTPRRPGSKWSKVNCAKATELIAAGRMRPAGLRQVELAKSDGRWAAAYDPPSGATVPADLRRELDRNDAARAFFDALDSHNRYAVLHRIQDAKKPETRARRIARYVAMLAANEKIHP
jgi:uncharacterized protein YdeI (YjbR/CyaY-like superfamily)